MFRVISTVNALMLRYSCLTMSKVDENRRRVLAGLGSAAAGLALYSVTRGTAYAYTSQQPGNEVSDNILTSIEDWFKRIFGFSQRTTTTTTTAAPMVTLPSVRSAGFGWEVVNLHNNGADMVVGVTEDMIIHWFDMDVSYMLTSPPSSEGFVEVLYTVGVTSTTPQFSSPPQVYQSLPPAEGFTGVTIVNPNNLQTVADAYPGQGFLTRLILKSWVPKDGTASQVQRHVTLYPNMLVKSGSYIVFHMDHAGVVSVDSEIQVTLGYSIVKGS